MQTPTHLTVGVQIDRALPDFKPVFARRLVIAFLGVYSHVFLDALSPLTYHPPEPSFKDRFWLCYHAALAVLTLRAWRKNRERHQWAMICSLLPDLDWMLIRIPKICGLPIPFWQQPVLHAWLFKTLTSLPPIWLLKYLPDLRQKKLAAIPELILNMRL